MVNGEPVTETDETAPTSAATGDSARPRRRRRALVIGLIIFTAILMLATALGTWVRRQTLDTDTWVATSTRVLDDPTVRTALSQFLVNQLYQSVDVGAQLQAKLPPDLQGLAGPLAGALREPATQAVDYLLGTSQFRTVWEEINRRAHATVVRILENKTRAGLSTANGNVTLDVSQLLHQLGTQLGLPSGVLDKIPASAGQLTIAKSDQLQAAQKAVEVLKFLTVFLFLAVFALFALAVYLAEGWRRVALRDVAIAIIVVGLVLAIVQRVVGNYIVNSVVSQPANRPPVRAIWLIGTELLRDMSRNIAAVGIAILLYAILTGPSRAAVRVRHFIAPALVGRPVILWVGAAVVFLLLVLWGPLPVLETWYGFLVGAVFFALGVEMLRRKCVQDLAAEPPREAPTPRSPWRWRPSSTDPGTAGVARTDVDQLERLQQLHVSGALTDEEFEAAKRSALGLATGAGA